MAGAKRTKWVTFSSLIAAGVGALLWFRMPKDRLHPEADGAYHVYPGQNIQTALDAAAADKRYKKVVVHSGLYRPSAHQQALVWFTKAHDGITLEASGEVVLSAANPEIAEKGAPSFPAVVNHVVFFGDGISRTTKLRGFKITGANGFATESEAIPIQPESSIPQLVKGMFFYTDGGGIKIFGRSYPTIEGCEIYDHFVSPCGAGISIEHRSFNEHAVLIKDCVLRNNRCTVTGAAIDVLIGSAAEIENCLFVANLSNTHFDDRSQLVGEWKPRHGSGALTVFPESRAIVRNCTFVGNRNGVDDGGEDSRYEHCIFWKNNVSGGTAPGERYELDVANASGVVGCFVNGDIEDLTGNVDRGSNVFECPNPEFDASYTPRAAGFEKVGYRPVGK